MPVNQRSSSAADLAVVCGLGVSQIIGYGTLYYAFSILAPSMARDLSWPPERVFAAFSTALLLGGIAGPWSGRAADRFGASRVMGVGSLAAGLALAACAVAPGPIAFVACLILVQVAATLVLYETAFVAIAQIMPAVATRRITHLTLIAGFASTLFWPLTALMVEYLDWRRAYLVFAAMHLVVCLPVHAMIGAMACPRAPRASTAERSGELQNGSLHPSLRLRGLLLMLAGFAFSGFALSALLVHLVPLLTALGLGPWALWTSAVFGPSQVLSRVINLAFGSGLAPATLAVISVTLLPAAILALAATAPSTVGALAFAVLFGCGSGLTSIAQGTVPLILFGRSGYGALLGRMTLVREVVSAIAPFVLAVGIERLGPTVALYLVATLGLAGVACLIELARLQSRGEPT